MDPLGMRAGITQTIFHDSWYCRVAGGWIAHEITVSTTHKNTRALVTALLEFKIGNDERLVYSLPIIGKGQSDKFSRKVNSVLSFLNSREIQEEIIESAKSGTVSETVSAILELLEVKNPECMEDAKA